MAQANNVFLITLTMMLFGFLLKKMDYITEKDGKIISKFLMHTTFPALMLVSTVRIKIEANLLLIPILGLVFGSILVLVASLVFRKYPNDLRGLLIMGAGGLNTGLFGFPIIESIWGRDALVYAIMLDIGNTIVVFGLVYTIGSYFASKGERNVSFRLIFKKVISSPPLQAMALGLLLNILKIPIPSVAMDFLDVLAKGNKPIVLLLMGIYLSFALDKKQVWAVSKVLLIRYTCGLLGVALLYCLMPKSLMQSILIVCLVLPAGLTLLPFSDEMNYDSRIAGLIVNLTLLISFTLMWGLVLGLNLV
ncbi:MAG: AEC family transporter [Saprospiraceae bacterium]|nr:AEC family transporter [Saprospiraceae bacterium]